jgi:cell division septum initiation protein DivIVA
MSRMKTNTTAKDIFGNAEAKARKVFKLDQAYAPYRLELIRGVWVCTWWSTTSRLGTKKYPNYSALSKGGKLVCGVGNRKETIDAVIGGAR